MRLLITTGGSPHSELALRLGAQIAHRAGVTPTLQARFLRLAAWYEQDDLPDLACRVYLRLWREDPASAGGQAWEAKCRPAQ